nr:protein SPT2 homolog [Coffea arabica]
MEEGSIEQPRKEELKFQQLRTKLKQVIRKKMSIPDQPVKSNHSLWFDGDYGSFFGPSQSSIAPRLLEDNALLVLYKKSEVALLQKNERQTGASGSKPLAASTDQKPSTSNILGARVQPKIMKESSLPSNARSTKEDRKLAVSDRQKQHSLGTGKSTSTSQPAGMSPKGIPVPMQDPKEKNKAAIQTSGRLENHNGATSTRLNPAAVSKQASIKREESQQLKKQQKVQIIKNSKPEASSQLRHLKRKKPDDFVDARAISIMIRKMYGYDPSKYHDNEKDDKAMEATFEDIQREERRSAKIARKQDQEELRKIVAEESKARMMKETAKKRKLIH